MNRKKPVFTTLNKIKTRITVITILSLLACPLLVIGQNVKVMSYNIKFDNVNDTINNWNDRKVALVDLLEKYNPEFIGMQEVLHQQLTFLDESLTDYDYIGVGRDDGKEKGEYSPILYNSKKYKVLNSTTFWLSKTPDKISVGWDASMERICTYGLFEDINSKQQIWIFNTHFDHIGVKAKKKSAKLILKKIKQINSENLPVILMGDFNLISEEKPIQNLQRKMQDGAMIPNANLQPKGTFNGFDTVAPIDRRIDYIFFKNVVADSYRHIDERLKNGKHISDHLPVLMVLKN